ncbi:MAG: hypothetical protein WCD18_27175 [Thermosynechococcaceae cyanobacterium]
MGKTIRAVRYGLLSIALLLLLPSLFLYVSLAVYGKRLLTLNEWSRFAGIIAFAGIAHLDTNGGPRAWAIAGESLSQAAISKVALTVDTHVYQIPLPPNTIRKNCDRIVAGLPKGSTGGSPWYTIPQSCLSGSEFPTEGSNFITLASPEEMNRYAKVTLPAAGWAFQDRLGSAWFFRNNDTQLMMNLGSYLTIFIADFSLDLSRNKK